MATLSADMVRAQARLQRLLALIEDQELRAEIERELERIGMLADRDRKKSHKFRTGIVADQPNASGLVYSQAVLERAREQYQTQIDQRRAFGCLDSLEDERMRLVNVSHRVTDLRLEEDGSLTATIEILDTNRGRVLWSLVNADVPMRLSARGTGTVNQDGRVGEDYRIVGFDAVPECDLHNPAVDRISFGIRPQPASDENDNNNE